MLKSKVKIVPVDENSYNLYLNELLGQNSDDFLKGSEAEKYDLKNKFVAFFSENKFINKLFNQAIGIIGEDEIWDLESILKNQEIHQKIEKGIFNWVVFTKKSEIKSAKTKMKILGYKTEVYKPKKEKIVRLYDYKNKLVHNIIEFFENKGAWYVKQIDLYHQIFRNTRYNLLKTTDEHKINVPKEKVNSILKEKERDENIKLTMDNLVKLNNFKVNIISKDFYLILWPSLAKDNSLIETEIYGDVIQINGIKREYERDFLSKRTVRLNELDKLISQDYLDENKRIYSKKEKIYCSLSPSKNNFEKDIYSFFKKLGDLPIMIGPEKVVFNYKKDISNLYIFKIFQHSVFDLKLPGN